MAVLQAILAFVSRSVGRILNTVFGWATMLLFGKVPEDRQIYLSFMAFGSVAWLAALLGIVFPSVGTFLLAFVPLPDWVNRTWIRLLMLGLALLIPAVVGFLATRMLDPEERPQGAGATLREVLKGYPYTLGLALTLILMILFAPFLKIPALLRRWVTVHVPVIVEPHDYGAVLGEIQKALAGAGWRTTREQASWMLRFPTRVLTALAGGAIESYVADQLTTLKAPNLEVTLHPSDLVISGQEKTAAHARAVLAEQLAFSPAHMTWTKEANELEDRFEALWREARDQAADPRALLTRLEAVAQELKRQDMEYEQWEVLYRQQLLIERALLRAIAGLEETPAAPADRATEAAHGGTRREEVARPAEPRPASLKRGLVQLALGSLLGWLERRRRRARA